MNHVCAKTVLPCNDPNKTKNNKLNNNDNKMRKKKCLVCVWIVEILARGKMQLTSKTNMVGFTQVHYLIKQFHVFFCAFLTSLSLEQF